MRISKTKMKDNGTGFLVTLEGVEGTGKSTLTAKLIADLTALGIASVATREPGGSSIGPTIRALLLDPNLPPLTDRTEALLFAADRAQHVAELITPALSEGKIVVCDRYLDSSVAYQGVGRNLGAKIVRDISEWAIDGYIPEITFLIDLDPEIGIGRKQTDEINRMENEKIEFHKAIREAFLEFANTHNEQKGLTGETKRWYILDGTATIEDIYDDIRRVTLLTWALKALEEPRYEATLDRVIAKLDLRYDPYDVSDYTLEHALLDALADYDV